MQARKHEWWQAKTGLLIRDITRKSNRFLTGITEHGQRVIFPESFLKNKRPDHAQVSWAENHLQTVLMPKFEKKEQKKIEEGLRDLKKKFGFHIIKD